MNLGIGTQRYMSSDLENSKKYEKKKVYKNKKSKRKETKIKKNTDNTINTALYLSFFTFLSSINYILNEKNIISLTNYYIEIHAIGIRRLILNGYKY